MNDHMKAHGKQMLVAGAGVAVLLAVLGAGWQQAVTWGLLLACPLGMVAMMWWMGRRGASHQHGRAGAAPDRDGSYHRTPDDTPDRVDIQATASRR